MDVNVTGNWETITPICLMQTDKSLKVKKQNKNKHSHQTNMGFPKLVCENKLKNNRD